MIDNYILMNCSYGRGGKEYVETKISNEDIDYINSFKRKWFFWKGAKKEEGKNRKCTGGYIRCTYKNKSLYLHDLIMRRIEDKPGENYSVDHINKDKLDNRRENLRWATQSEQNSNRDKKNRKHNARDLPEGITQDMLKKYVVYYKECYNKEKDLWREFFKVEKHPKLDKPWIGSKSEKISIKNKLKQANQIVEDLDNDTYEKKEKELPTYYTINKAKTHLIYDRKLDNGERENIKMKLPDEYDLEEQITIIQEKVREKQEKIKEKREKQEKYGNNN